LLRPVPDRGAAKRREGTGSIRLRRRTARPLAPRDASGGGDPARAAGRPERCLHSQITDESGLRRPIVAEVYPSAANGPVVHVLFKTVFRTRSPNRTWVVPAGWRTLDASEQIPALLRKLGMFHAAERSRSPLGSCRRSDAESCRKTGSGHARLPARRTHRRFGTRAPEHRYSEPRHAIASFVSPGHSRILGHAPMQCLGPSTPEWVMSRLAVLVGDGRRHCLASGRHADARPSIRRLRGGTLR
jgi:hypothetical protein